MLIKPIGPENSQSVQAIKACDVYEARFFAGKF
jgi:hypothetical protein